MANARQRGTGVRIRSEAKAAAADRLLLAAQDESYAFQGLKHDFLQTPKWKVRKRRRLRASIVLTLERYHAAVTAAQDVAKKGRYVELD